MFPVKLGATKKRWLRSESSQLHWCFISMISWLFFGQTHCVPVEETRWLSTAGVAMLQESFTSERCAWNRASLVPLRPWSRRRTNQGSSSAPRHCELWNSRWMMCVSSIAGWRISGIRRYHDASFIVWDYSYYIYLSIFLILCVYIYIYQYIYIHLNRVNRVFSKLSMFNQGMNRMSLTRARITYIDPQITEITRLKSIEISFVQRVSQKSFTDPQQFTDV